MSPRLLSLLCPLAAAALGAQEPPAAQGGGDSEFGKGRFVYERRDKAIEVFTYRPPSYDGGPLLVVMHGMDRNADEYRDRAVALADRFGALAVAPRFDHEQFPVEAYQRGGVTRDREPQPREEWTFQYIVEIVEEVRRREERPDMPYYLIGHSAGGQFLARLAAFLPGGAERIVAGNPGSLIFPTRDIPFQYGFGNLPDELSDDEALRAYLAAPLTLYLGTADTGDENLDQSEFAKRQGPTRIARGRACYEMGEALARERGWTFGWRLVEAEGVGHSSAALFQHDLAEEALFGPTSPVAAAD
jgi:poly(3-hydroxybutyrate) depolymerase